MSDGAADPEFEALKAQLRTEELTLLTDNSQGTLALACLMYALTGDIGIGDRAKAQIMELAHAHTWSGRPDPLLMGGDNDRGIGLRLYHTALAWDYMQPLFNEEERRAILAKVEEYLQKIYDFTLLAARLHGLPDHRPAFAGSVGTALRSPAWRSTRTLRSRVTRCRFSTAFSATA